MREGRFIGIATLMVAIVCMLPLYADEVQWKKAGTRGGVEYYIGTTANSVYEQYRGIGIVNQPIEVVGELIRDIPSYPLWMYNCKEARVLKVKALDQNVVYFVHDSDWPVRDRDIVVENVRVADDANGKLVVTICNVDDYPYPSPDGVIRMEMLKAVFILEYIDRKTTRVTFDLAFNPGANLSPTILHPFMRPHPYRTLQGIQRVAAQPKYAKLGLTSRDFAFAEQQFKKRGK